MAQAEAQPEQEQKVKSLDSLGWIVVTPDGPRDGGQFGKHTPGTATSGLQEAFDHAAETGQDVYICGGGRPRYVWYTLQETLRIPWMQNWRCDGGEYFIGYHRPTGDAVVIDSMMSTKIKLGGIASNADGAVVRIAPGAGGPDGYAGIGGTLLELNALCGKGVALWLDASKGPIICCWIFTNELNAADKGLVMTGTQGIQHNRIKFASHLTNTAIEIGNSETLSANYHDNHIEAWIQGAIPGSVGARIRGQRNFLTLTCEQFAPGKDIVFEPEARDNLIIAQKLPNGITNNARVPTNRIITLTPVGFDIPTPPIPASREDAVNRSPYPVQVIFLTAGQVSEWTLADAGGSSRTIAAGLSPGQSLVLKPGDRIRFTYTHAPSWAWNALG